MKSAVNSFVSLFIMSTLLLSNLLSNNGKHKLSHLCTERFTCLSIPSLSSLPPNHLHILHSTQWGNQSACYSLISDLIQLLILVSVSQCRNQSCHISQLLGWASEVRSRTMNRCWLGSFTAIVTNRHTVAIWIVTMTDFPSSKKTSKQILPAGAWCCVVTAQKISYSGQTLINDGWKHHMAPTWKEAISVKILMTLCQNINAWEKLNFIAFLSFTIQAKAEQTLFSIACVNETSPLSSIRCYKGGNFICKTN